MQMDASVHCRIASGLAGTGAFQSQPRTQISHMPPPLTAGTCLFCHYNNEILFILSAAGDWSNTQTTEP